MAWGPPKGTIGQRGVRRRAGHGSIPPLIPAAGYGCALPTAEVEEPPRQERRQDEGRPRGDSPRRIGVRSAPERFLHLVSGVRGGIVDLVTRVTQVLLGLGDVVLAPTLGLEPLVVRQLASPFLGLAAGLVDV